RIRAPPRLHARGARTRVVTRTDLPAFVASSGGRPEIVPGSQHLSSSKGQTRRKPATQSDRPLGHAIPWWLRCRRGGLVEEPVRSATYGDREVRARGRY